MKLLTLNKVQYKKNMNLVLVIFLLSLAVLSVIFGQILIALLGNTQVVSGESTGNTSLNFLGVFLAAAVCVKALLVNKHKVWLKEIFYVWELKQLQNKIYRKLDILQRAAEQNEVNALLVLSFYYDSLYMVYTLDNNTLTITEVVKHQNKISQQLIALSIEHDTQTLDLSLLEGY